MESIKWGGDGFLFSASRDRTIKVWGVEPGNQYVGNLVRTLAGHGHRVNTLALSTEHACRTGCFDHEAKAIGTDRAAAAALAKARFLAAAKLTGGKELLVSGSDDYTLFVWKPAADKKPIARLTGHQGLVNHLAFSPDSRLLASASFDKKVKLWHGVTGRFVSTLVGHVAAVYMVAWSADSRLLISASKDSTVKVWKAADNAGRKGVKAESTLPGHSDEVYALDWSPNGARVASGSKDRTIKVWTS